MKAAWHWGSDRSVLNDHLEEQGCTPLYVSLPSTWGSVDGDCMFSPHIMRRLLFADSNRYKWMNKPLALETEHLSPYRPCWRNIEGAPLLWGFLFWHTYLGSFYLDPEVVGNLSCDTEEETSVHILCEWEALASLRHAYLGSFFLDLEDVRKLSRGANWNFGKGKELL